MTIPEIMTAQEKRRAAEARLEHTAAAILAGMLANSSRNLMPSPRDAVTLALALQDEVRSAVRLAESK